MDMERIKMLCQKLIIRCTSIIIEIEFIEP